MAKKDNCGDIMRVGTDALVYYEGRK